MFIYMLLLFQDLRKKYIRYMRNWDSPSRLVKRDKQEAQWVTVEETLSAGLEELIWSESTAATAVLKEEDKVVQLLELPKDRNPSGEQWLLRLLVLPLPREKAEAPLCWVWVGVGTRITMEAREPRERLITLNIFLSFTTTCKIS